MLYLEYCLLEYNVLQPSPLNEKVLKDKRKKLRDTFDRVMKMYVSIVSSFNIIRKLYSNYVEVIFFIRKNTNNI